MRVDNGGNGGGVYRCVTVEGSVQHHQCLREVSGGRSGIYRFIITASIE